MGIDSNCSETSSFLVSIIATEGAHDRRAALVLRDLRSARAHQRVLLHQFAKKFCFLAQYGLLFAELSYGLLALTWAIILSRDKEQGSPLDPASRLSFFDFCNTITLLHCIEDRKQGFLYT